MSTLPPVFLDGGSREGHLDPSPFRGREPWHGNFERHWPEMAAAYDETFRRMWRYPLLQCAGDIRVRKNQPRHIVLSRNPRAKYRSIG